jgi:hypothetical protein
MVIGTKVDNIQTKYITNNVESQKILGESIIPMHSDNVLYNGPEINCLNITGETTLTQVVKNISDKLCYSSNPNPIIVCDDILFPTPQNGECQNPLYYLFNQAISSWCISLPDRTPCTGLNPLEYLLNNVTTAYNEENPPLVPCTGLNPLEYLFSNVTTAYNEGIQPLVPCTGLNALEYLLNNVTTTWNNENP